MKYTDIPQPIRDKMNVDELVFGNAFCLKEEGKFTRIDPMKLRLINGEYKIVEEKKTLRYFLYSSEHQYLRQGGKKDEMIVCSLSKLQGAIKEFICYFKSNSPIADMIEWDVSVDEKAKEIFGERLI